MSSFENFVKCRVVSPLAANATDIALYDAVAPFNLPPVDGGVLVLTDSPNNPSVIEVIRYSYRNALGLYGVQRGQEGTAAVAWSGPVYCYQSLMADDFQALLDSKVDKAAGQSLMLDAERSKLAGIAPGAQVNSVNSVNGKTGSVALVKADVGLGNADNTSDANKPVSTAQQAALDTKVDKVTGKGLSTNDLTAALLAKLNGAAPLASPVLTGNPTAPTPAADDNDTSIATTAFVRAAMALFGVGGLRVHPETNLNLYIEGGNFITPVSGLSSLPAGWVQGRHILIVAGGTLGAYTSQILFGGSVNSGRVALRAWSGTAYTDWQEIWHTGNLVKQTTAADTTAGALMAVGAFGWNGGNAIAVSGTADADNYKTPGLYIFGSNGTNLPVPAMYPFVWVAKAESGAVRQLAFSVNTNRKASRVFFNGVWSAWAEDYSSANILGTVSQSGGVPTGAIIERGSNANGEWVRFADGTQECICRAAVDFTNYTGQLTSGVWSLSPSLPAAFVPSALAGGSVSMLHAGYNSIANRFLSRMQLNITAAGVPTLYRLDNTDMANFAETREIRVSVHGRWY